MDVGGPSRIRPHQANCEARSKNSSRTFVILPVPHRPTFQGFVWAGMDVTEQVQLEPSGIAMVHRGSALK
jgi:hypothetical protein